MSPETRKEKRRRAGRLGGVATREKYGLSFFKINGARGGRPRVETLDKISRQQSLRNENEARRMDTTGASLTRRLNDLKRLWRERQKSNGGFGMAGAAEGWESAAVSAGKETG